MDVLMPQLGETVAEGKISAWFKSVGDPVNAGDNLFEVETDKTAMEVPSTVAGVIAEIRVSAGETVPVGTVIAVIGQAGADVAPVPNEIVSRRRDQIRADSRTARTAGLQKRDQGREILSTKDLVQNVANQVDILVSDLNED